MTTPPPELWLIYTLGPASPEQFSAIPGVVRKYWLIKTIPYPEDWEQMRGKVEYCYGVWLHPTSETEQHLLDVDYVTEFFHGDCDEVRDEIPHPLPYDEDE
jgi:hypothetical protein